MKNGYSEITVNAHSSIRIGGSKVVRFDPFLVEDAVHDADVVFITHDHFDHYSEEDLKKVSKADTVVVAPKNAGEVRIPGLSFQCVPAYNLDKKFHPKANGWLGYLVTMDGKTYYVAGDTDATPEMKAVKADVALLPVGGTYTMTAEEAALAAKEMDVETFIPTHYGSVVGEKTDGECFRTLVKDAKKVLLKL